MIFRILCEVLRLFLSAAVQDTTICSATYQQYSILIQLSALFSGFWISFGTAGVLCYHRADNSFLVSSSKYTGECLQQKVGRHKNPYIGRYCSRTSVSFSLAVAGRLTFKSPPFHDTLKAFTNSVKKTIKK